MELSFIRCTRVEGLMGRSNPELDFGFDADAMDGL
jgi:hypothetical protein